MNKNNEDYKFTEEDVSLYCYEHKTWINQFSNEHHTTHKDCSLKTEDMINQQSEMLSHCREFTKPKKPMVKFKFGEKIIKGEIIKTLPTTPEMGETILSEFDFIVIEELPKILWLRDNRIYNPNGETKLKEILVSSLENLWTPSVSSAIVKYVMDKKAIPREKFDENKMIVNFKNCFLDTATGKVMPDYNKYKSLLQIETKYQPQLGRSELFEDFCKQLSPQHWELMLEILGCAMTRQAINPEKILILVGRSSNGKSTLLRIIKILYGARNVSSETMDDIQSDKFSAVQLVDKLLNIYAELPADVSMKGFNQLKTLTTTGEMQSVQDKAQPKYTVDLTCTLTFSTNLLPDLPNHDEAIYRRLTIINFGTKFKKDNSFIKKFIDDEKEMQRILNSLIFFLNRVRDNNGDLTNPQTEEEVRELWRSHSDTTTLFITSKLRPIKDNEKEVSIQECQTALIEFCTKAGKPVPMAMQFNNRMEKFNNEIKTTRRDGQSIRVWRGITLIRSDDGQEKLTEKSIREDDEV